MSGNGSIDPGLRELLAKAADAKKRGVSEDKINAGIRAVLQDSPYANGIKDYNGLLAVVQKATGNPVTVPESTSLQGPLDRARAALATIFSGASLGHGDQLVQQWASAAPWAKPVPALKQYHQDVNALHAQHPYIAAGEKFVGSTLPFAAASSAAGALGAGPIQSLGLGGAATAAAEGTNKSPIVRAFQGLGGYAAGTLAGMAGSTGFYLLNKGLTKAAKFTGKVATDRLEQLGAQWAGKTMTLDGATVYDPAAGGVRIAGLRDVMAKRLAKTGKEFFDPLRKAFPDVGDSPAIQKLFARDPNLQDALAARRGLRNASKLNVAENPPSWDELVDVRRRLGTKAAGIQRSPGGDKSTIKDLYSAQNELTNTLDQLTGGQYRAANAKYSVAALRHEALDDGANYMQGSTAKKNMVDNLDAAAQKYAEDPIAQRNFQIGAMTKFYNNVEGKGGDVTLGMWEKLQSVTGRAQAKYLLFGNDEEAAANFQKLVAKGKRAKLAKDALSRMRRHIGWVATAGLIYSGFELFRSHEEQGVGGGG